MAQAYSTAAFLRGVSANFAAIHCKNIFCSIALFPLKVYSTATILTCIITNPTSVHYKFDRAFKCTHIYATALTFCRIRAYFTAVHNK